MIVLSLFASACASLPEMPLASTVELHGHRGARGLAPENTWPAFAQALRYGMNVLELDTVLTADGDLIVHHDTETNPMICQRDDGSAIVPQPIRTLTVAELKKLDCGSIQHKDFPQQELQPKTRLLTLSEFFRLVKEYEAKNNSAPVHFNIETKFPQGKVPDTHEVRIFAETLVRQIRAAGMERRSVVQSFRLEILPVIKELAPALRTAALFEPTKWQGLRMYLGLGSGIRREILDAAQRVQANIISPYKLYASSDFVRAAHSRGLLVIPWTVNDSAEMAELFDRGVDGIISDYPDRLAAVWARRSKK